MEMTDKYKVFNDCIHGHIKLHPLCVKIVDTPEFQRLRNLKQVGPVYFVYPGACHNRFEHSLGVCHLAGKMVEALRKNCNDKNIVTDDEKLCLEIAGLCHDLGHGPFSHMWEAFLKAAGERSGSAIEWKHEEASVEMFEHLLKKNGLREVVEKEVPELNKTAIEFIKGLIKGEGQLKRDKKFLYQIISNKENGIDVDRWDYFLRDGYQLNLSFSFDYSRILEFCRVIEVHGEKIICFRNKERHNIYDMFQVRVNLFYKANTHDVVRTINEMFIDALLEADRNEYKIRVSKNKAYALSEAHKHVEALSRMTDHIIYDVLYSTEDKFKQARELLNRILKRDLYRIVDSKNFSAELLARMIEKRSDDQEVDKVSKIVRELEQEIKDHIKEKCKGMQHCKYEQFKVIKSKLDMGVELKYTLGKNNPFSNIYFYAKQNVNEAKQMKWKDVTFFPVPEESVHHVHFLVIYKDIENPVRKNDTLKTELDEFEAKLKESWDTFGQRRD